MTEMVTVVPGTRTLIGPDWELRAERVDDSGTGWSAILGVRGGLKLLVTGDDAEGLLVEAWTGQPEESDGAAIVDMGDDAPRLTAVPLCGCGERGCGNSGVQFRKEITARALPALIAMLRDLPWTDIVPTRSNVLCGTELAAIERLRGK